ncbi:hypothetical protein Pcinc_035777 [Petrolisthes cinctipes]|uniref:GPS domain-containing protein n=1 Tax=Petrolisthes cinctipes TaxID=88211 RepID=A0AAE1BWA5_PETCI|nr:hypothetical protein Pcinc_035777 [Petrolisthes cinctipes]
MTDSGNKDNNIAKVEGPTGFGTAISLDPIDEQCRVHRDYTHKFDNCSRNPAECEDGFSISVWYKTYYESTAETHNTDATGKKQTLFSTGGDAEGHPGVHAYLEDDLELNVVVCNGTHFWHSLLIGVFFENSWTNLGVKWSDSEGLEVYLKHTSPVILGNKTYSDLIPKAKTTAPEPVPGGAKTPLDPSEIMLGCHKDSDNPTYRQFAEGAFDELATWTRVVEDPIMFLGGYSETLGEGGIESLKETADTANYKDAETSAAMLNALNSVSSSEEEEDEVDDGVAPTSSPTSATSGTQPSPTATSSAPPPEDQKDFKDMLKILSGVTSTVPDNVLTSNIERLMVVVKSTSNMLGPKYKDNFLAELQESDNPGAAGVLSQVNTFTLGLVTNLELTPNQTRDGYTINKDMRNIKLQGWKRDLDTLRDEGEAKRYWQAPDCDKIEEDPLWSFECSRVAVTHEIIPWEECGNWTVSTVITANRNYHNIAPFKYNLGRLNPALPKMLDSRTIDVRVDVSPPDDYVPEVEEKSDVVSFTMGEEDDANEKEEKKSPCHPTKQSLMDKPVRLKLYHLNKNLRRKILFHQDEENKQMVARHCVFWNVALGDYGEWDPAGCKIVDTTDTYTRCACARLGTFAVLTEKVEPKIVPEEEIWLTMMRYAGYVLSFLFIIAYIIIVIVSK